jgi:phosphodiesterase/alkaline phosphatase D-like protein
VYSDGLDEVSVKERLKSDEDITDAELVATYRHLHRGYFNEPGFRSVTESLPTYLTWDDHDIFDGWGSQLAPRDHDRRLYRAAERAYVEYQHLRNPGARLDAVPPFHYRFWFGDVGFFVLDLRGCRSYQEKQVLGEQQWSALEAFFAEAGERGAATVFLVASVPVVHFSPFIANSLDWVPGSKGTDVRDRWSVAAFAKERERLLALLFEWQAKDPRRQVVILSGDVHVGTAFRVRRKRGSGELIQWVSSALSTPGGLKHSVVNRIGTRLVNVGEGTTHARRRGFASRNNFGSVHVEPLPEGGHRLSFTVHEHDRDANRLRVGLKDTATAG